MRTTWFGSLAILFSAVGYGTLPLFGKVCLENGMDVSSLILFRFGAATLCFFLIGRMKRAETHAGSSTRLNLLFLGAGPYALATAFYLAAVRTIPASIAVMLVFLYPLWVTLIANRLSRERLTRQTLVPVLLAVSGVALMTAWSNTELEISGMFFGLLAGICFGGYIAFSKLLCQGVETNEASLFVCLGATMTSLLGNLLFSRMIFPPLSSGWALGGLVFLSTVAPIGAFLFGIRYVSAPKAAILSTLEPVVTVGLSLLFLRESVSVAQMGGAVLILSACLLIRNQRSQ